MKNTKLIALLRTFTAAELRQFGDFVASPFFNKRQELVQFYSLLRQCAPEFAAEQVDRQRLFQLLYPSEPFNSKQVDYLSSFLLKLAEQFIGHQHYQSDPLLPAYHQMAALVERDLDKHYRFLHRKALNQLEQSPIRGTNYYFHRFLVANLAQLHFTKKQVRKQSEELQEAADWLDQFYLASKLNYCSEMLDMQAMMSASYRMPLLKEIMAFLAAQTDLALPIEIYYKIVQAHLSEGDEANFEVAIQLIREHSDIFPLPEMKRLYLFAANYCARKIRQQQAQFVPIALDLYMAGIENGIAYEDGFLRHFTYKNIVRLGLTLERYDWTEHFIKDYYPQLKEEYQQDALHYNLAELSYSRRNYDDVLSHLNQVEFSDIHYNLGARKLLLKVYYEQQEMELLMAQIAAFRIFLQRNKLMSSKMKASYQNFLSLLKRIVNATPDNRPRLQPTIESTLPLTAGRWLLEKCKA